MGVDSSGVFDRAHPAIAELLRRMPPPESTRRIPDVPWRASFDEIGFSFPQDYQCFVETYGSGSVCGDLAIVMPWRAGGPEGLPEMEGFGLFMVRVEKMSYLNRFHTDAPERWPYAFWPEHGGLLPWARNREYGYFFWLTGDADPDRWTCVAWDQREWRAYGCGMAELLLRAVNDGDPFLSSIVAPDSTPIVWQSNGLWPARLPESIAIDDDDDWCISAASRERGEDDGPGWA